MENQGMKNLIYDKNKSVVVAENWNELTTKQYLNIAKLLHAGITDETEACEKALFILSQKSLLKYFFIHPHTRLLMHEHVEWIFEQKGITKQLLPRYKGMYGPDDEFNNLRMKEFHAAEMAFYQLSDEKHIDHLDELVAVLYRPARKDYDIERNIEGDIRIPYNSNETAFFKQQIKRWPLNIKRAIYMWYDGCRQQLEEEHQPAFESNNTGSSKNYFDGMYGMMRSIAEKKTYGDFNAVGELYVRLAFKEIVETKLEERELKNKYPELYK